MTDDTVADGGEDDVRTDHAQRAIVRDRYGSLAADADACCGDTDGCCDSSADSSRSLGYTDDDLDAAPEGANLGLGCGNPTAIASLEAGDTVLDLGSGGGFDCFLAAREVGPSGRVIGVDMTPEMLERARGNAERNDAGNVEFRLGEIEALPVADASVDVILSNCVVNLSPDKPSVFREAFRVLAPGGRLAISDVVRIADLPADLQTDPDSTASCVGGAATVSALETMVTDAGFTDVTIEPVGDSESFISNWDDDHDLADALRSATIEATKPGTEQPDEPHSTRPHDQPHTRPHDQPHTRPHDQPHTTDTSQ